MEVKKPSGSNEGDDGGLSNVPGSGTENLNVQTNPLLVDLILDKIFGLIISPIQETSPEDSRIKLPAKDKKMVAGVVKDVQNFRLVCKLWRKTATTIFKEFRGQMVFGVAGEGTAEEELLDGNESRPNLKRFLNVMKDSAMIPATKYVLWTPLFRAGNQKLVNDFFEVCGPDIVSLKVAAEFLSSPVKIKLGKSGLLNLQKLTSLYINVQHFDTLRINPEKCQNVGSLFGLILKSAPSLQQLQMQYGEMEPGKEGGCAELFSFTSGSLKRVMMDCPEFSDKYLKTFVEKKMKLDSCKIYAKFTEEMSCSEDLVRKFFQMQSKTLEVLTWPTSSSSLLSKGFPKMEELIGLRMDGESSVPIPFAETFPKLKVLNLSNLNSSSDKAIVELFSCTNTAPSVEELLLPELKLRMELVKKMAKIFPSVKKLRASGGGGGLSSVHKILPEVFTHFSSIEELCVVFRMMLMSEELDGDAIFTGIPKETCEQIRRNGNFKNVNHGALQREPSILQLTKLKKLVLTGCNQVTFTDLAAQLTFLKMDSLKELHSDGFEQMKRKSLKQLKEKLKLTVEESQDSFFFPFSLLNLTDLLAGDNNDEINGSDSDFEWETDSSFEDLGNL